MSKDIRTHLSLYSFITTCVTWAISFCMLSSYAQTVTVSHSSSGQGIEAVSIFSGNKGVLTDSLGQASLELFGPEDSLSFRHIGFAPLELSWEEIQQKDFHILLTAQILALSEVPILFNHWAQRRSEIAQQITRISGEDVRLQQPQTAADMLGVSGEVFIQKSQQGGGSPMIRGFSANRVLLVIDGVRMNNAIYRSGNLHNVISLDPFAMDHTEVVFGPGSVVFGSDALGGVMDFHTLKHEMGKAKQVELTQGKAMGRYASANQEKTGHLDVNLATDRWSWILSASFSDFEDLRMGREGPEAYLRTEYVDTSGPEDIVLPNPDPLVQRFSGYSQRNFMQKLHFNASENLTLDYGFHYSKSSDIPRYDRLIESTGSEPREAEWYYGPQKWLMHTLGAHSKKASPFFDNWKITAAYQQIEESRNDRDFKSPVLRTRTEEVDILSLNLDAKKSFAKDIQLFYGAEYLGNWIASRAQAQDILEETVLPISTRYPDGSTWQSLASYVSAIYALDSLWTLTGGMRYNHIFLYAPFDRRFFPFPFEEINRDMGAFNGSIGTIFSPNTAWQFQANIASGFRAPNIDDIGKVFDSEPGNVILPNPALKPEYAYSFDLGLLHQWGINSLFSLNTFYTFLDNAIVRRNFSFQGRDSIFYDGTLSRVQADVNAESAQLYGIQLKLEIDFQPWLRMTSAYTWMEGKDQDDLPLRHVAPNFGATHLIFRQKDLSLDMYGIYHGEIAAADLALSEQNKPHIYATDGAGNPFSPSWYTLNIKSSFSFTQQLTVHLGIENITNQRYRPYSSGIAAAGRNWVFSVEQRW